MKKPIDENNFSNAVWQTQGLEAPRMSLQYIRHQSEKLNSDARRELLAAYIGTALCAMLGVFVFLRSSAPFVWVSALLLLLGAGYLTLQVRRRGEVQQTEVHEQPVQSLQAYRTALQRRRNYYFGLWRWSFWPLVPVMVVLVMGETLYDERPGKWLRLGVIASWIVLGSLVSCWVYWRKGKSFQDELDALTTLDEK